MDLFEDVFDVFPFENGGYSIAMLVYCRVAGVPYLNMESLPPPKIKYGKPATLQ